MKDHWIITEEPMAGYYLKNIFRLLWQNRFRMHVKYIPRFLYGIIVATLFLPFRLIESIRFNGKIDKTKVEKDPVFIIGYYRSGTTYLITMFSKDKSKGYVSNIEGYLPGMFLAFPKFSEWIIAMSLPEERPMDSVEMSPWEPTEEEYSIGAKDEFGIYNGFIFPRKFRHYSKYNSFEGMPKELARWKKAFQWFTRKMTIRYHGKQIIYKNPSATYRIDHILEMYPNAKFVLIHRNPYELFESNVRYHREVFAIYALQTWDDADMQQTILDNYRELCEKLEQHRKLLGKDRLVEIHYEDFVKNPVDQMKKIYTQLGIEGYKEAEPAFKAHFDSQKNYKAHKYEFSDDTINKVNDNWGHFTKKFGYTLLKPKSK